MSFSNHIFYEHINFDVHKKLYRSIAVKQGDTGSRGFFVRVIQNSEVIDISDKTMTFYCKKPDGTKVYIDAVKDGDKFRVDLTNQVSAVPGKVECELTLKGPDDEIISDKTFSITVEPSLQYGSMLSQSELSDFGRHLADNTSAHGIDNKANKIQEDWIAPTLLNGWTTDETNPLRFRKNAFGVVEMRGRAIPTNATANHMFTLPLGYRPVATFVIASVTDGSNPIEKAYASHTSGAVGISSRNTSYGYYSLDGFCFPTY